MKIIHYEAQIKYIKHYLTSKILIKTNIFNGKKSFKFEKIIMRKSLSEIDSFTKNL